VRPTTEIDGVRAAHRKLAAALDDLSEDVIRTPSLLPGWSVAHVLAHLARNADSVVRRLQGAIDDVVVDQYVGGKAGRAAEIEQSAQVPVAELVGYVRRSADAVDRIVDQVPDHAWDRVSRAASGDEYPARYVVYSRWREVEIHLVDLGLGYQPDDWPDDLLARTLPGLLEDLPGRTDPRQLLAWITGRAGPPELADWG
jgi:maleylpyruvate isomerase